MAPLADIFTPDTVVQMRDEDVSSIVDEPEATQQLRDELARKLAVLKTGLETCSRYSGRRSTIRALAVDLPLQQLLLEGKDGGTTTGSDDEPLAGPSTASQSGQKGKRGKKVKRVLGTGH